MNAAQAGPSLAAQIANLPKLAMSDLWAVWDKYFPQRPPHHNRAYVEGRVAYKGPVRRIIFQLVGGLRQAMGYCGAGTIDLEVDPIELENRARHWQPRETRYGSGAIWKFAQGVGPAHLGAVTHPGFQGEKHVYADI